MDLIISDIHADFISFNKILDLVFDKEFEQKYGKISRILNLGDVLNLGTHPKEVLNKLSSLEKNFEILSVMGNHDEAFFNNMILRKTSAESLRAHKELSENDLSFFKKNLNGKIGQDQIIDSSRNISLFHGGPLNPNKIIPKNNINNTLYYQKTWQRISPIDANFFHNSGYNYTPLTAFNEMKNFLKNFILFCGHQHKEAIYEEYNDNVRDLLKLIPSTNEKISNNFLQKRKIIIEKKKNYLIRIGLSGPEGSHNSENIFPHFGIFKKDVNEVLLFNFSKI